MNILSKHYKSFENKVSLIGYVLMTILGLVFILGIVNPITIPKKEDFESFKGVIEKLDENKFSVLISLKHPQDFDVQYLKRSGDWKTIKTLLNNKVDKPLDFICTSEKIYFRLPKEENTCFVFAINDSEETLIDFDDSIARTSKLNTYFFIFGLILLLYGSFKMYLLSKKNIF